MKIRSPKTLFLWLLLVLIFTISSSAYAARGAPGSAAFGIGATLHPAGPFASKGLQMALDLQLDWVAVPLDWAEYQPQAGAQPNFDALVPVLGSLSRSEIGVMIQFGSPPTWAQTASGPAVEPAAQFLASLIERFPGQIQAVELFPGANTTSAWGAAPDPAAYLTLYQHVRSVLRDQDPSMLIIAAGLQPVAAGDAGAVSDLVFLQSLYDLGAAQVLDMLSVQYPTLVGDPFQLPGSAEPRVLRRYEDIRRVMVKNNNSQIKIWITNSCLPSVTIDPQTSQKSLTALQSDWLLQAHMQLRAQLYVGAVFLQSLNVEREGMDEQIPSLLDQQANIHPFFEMLQSFIAINNSDRGDMGPGKPKDGSLAKNRP